MRTTEFVERFRAVDRRRGRFGIEVEVTPVGDRDWRADFSGQEGCVLLTGQARLIDGRLTVTSVHLDIHPIGAPEYDPRDPATLPVPPPGGVTSDLLRAVPMSTIAADIRNAILSLPEFDELDTAVNRPPSQTQRGLHATAAHDASGDRTVPRRGRPGVEDDELLLTAHVALAAQREGHRIRAAVAEALDVPCNTARDRIRQARVVGYLAPTDPGQRGAFPGPNIRPLQGERHGK